MAARPFGNKNKVINTDRGLKAGTNRALDVMLNRPVSPAEDNPTSSAERVALLLNRIKTIQRGTAPNKYQRSFVDFLFDLVKTKDEAAGGRVAHLPRDPYIFEMIDALMENSLLLIEKSRRVRASWIMCAFDVWIAAGGQDPRWPVLMNATGNRQIVVVSRKLQDAQGSSWFLRNRIKFIIDTLEDNNIREHWPEFPEFSWTATEGRASNGSIISAIASGADQARGVAATVVHGEEAAFWIEAKPTIESMLPVLLGGGHLVLVTTPQANSYCHKIVSDVLGDKGHW